MKRSSSVKKIEIDSSQRFFAIITSNLIYAYRRLSTSVSYWIPVDRVSDSTSCSVPCPATTTLLPQVREKKRLSQKKKRRERGKKRERGKWIARVHTRGLIKCTNRRVLRRFRWPRAAGAPGINSGIIARLWRTSRSPSASFDACLRPSCTGAKRMGWRRGPRHGWARANHRPRRVKYHRKPQPDKFRDIARETALKNKNMQMPRNLSLPLRTRVLLLLVLRVLSILAIARATVERDGISSITRRGESFALEESKEYFSYSSVSLEYFSTVEHDP